jgi:uncharacterized Zn finger protein
VDALELPRGTGVSAAAPAGAVGLDSLGIATMPPRKAKQPTPAGQRSESLTALRHALTRTKKADLVEVLLELAQADRGVLRQLTARLDVAVSNGELAAATRQAIADATAFDKRDINRNFAHDYEAYGEVKRNLGRLIDAGQLPVAMQLALDLMGQGSYQVEMSDEGLMTHDIEGCLDVVLKALAKCDLPAVEVIAWCSAMQDNDRVGFIAREPLQSLRNRAQATAGR